jgi:hypothetical protein
MNPTSDAQKQQLFFAPCKNLKTDEMMPAERLFDTDNDEGTIPRSFAHYRAPPLRVYRSLLSRTSPPFVHPQDCLTR